MGTDYPELYRSTHGEAQRLGEVQRCEASFRLNVECARAIEQAIINNFNEADETLREGCARSVLDQYGFERVRFVLSNSLREMGCKHLVSAGSRYWGQKVPVPPDGKYNRYYTVDTAACLLDAFVQQTQQAYQALGLFGPEHCVGEAVDQDFKDKVLVLSPDALKESCWDPHNQLWYGLGGSGCRPHPRRKAVYAVCLGDGEAAGWSRSDFAGVLDEKFLPDWARDRLQDLRDPEQEQSFGPMMGGMSMK